MRIGRVQISRVGPLRGRDLSLEPGLNLVYGRNEAGKTALVDFLATQLFRREGRRGTKLATVMRGVDRFSESREGQVELHLDGEVLVYPGAPSLLGELRLGYSGLSGLFCVRSGEMEWPEKEEGEFWAALKKLLSGLPEGVETLRKEAHSVGGLTETGQRMNREDRPLLDTYRAARERAAALQELRQVLPEAREHEESIARLEREIERLDRARRARIAELHGRLEKVRQEREELPRIPRDELERWRELEVREEARAQRIAELEEAVRQARERRRLQEEEVARRETVAGELESRRERIQERELEERARDHLSRAREDGAVAPAGGDRRDALIAGAAAGVAVVLILLVVADLLGPGIGIAGALAGAAVAAWLGRRHRRAQRRREEHRRSGERLLREAGELGLEATEAVEIPGAVEALRREASEAGERLRVAQVELRHAKERLEEARQELESAGERLRETREGIEELASRLDVDDLPAAEDRHRRRRDLAGRVERLQSALAELAGSDPEEWAMEPPPDAGELPDWDGDRRARLERRLEETRGAFREIRDRFVQAGLPTPEDALTELEECRREMRAMERDWAAGRLAGAIFARMDESLERRLTEVLADEGPFSAGQVIQRITGRYVSVSRTGGEGLSVRDEEGRRFPVAELSRGTRDQVYLALRIALAEAALTSTGAAPGGFFLLDDPFLTADWTRRERLVETVSELADSGWQLIYLTCDDHLRELFVEAGATLHELG